MSDPRASISRTVLALPPTVPVTGPVRDAAVVDAESPAGEPGRLIGKRHGNMRSVGLLLTRPASDELRRVASATGATLGEAVMDALRDRHEQLARPPDQRDNSDILPRRSTARIRRGADTTTVHVLLTEPEARALSAIADACQLSVSDLASRALTDALQKTPTPGAR